MTGFSGENVPVLEVVMPEEVKQTEAVLQCNIEHTSWSFLGKCPVLYFSLTKQKYFFPEYFFQLLLIKKGCPYLKPASEAGCRQ